MTTEEVSQSAEALDGFEAAPEPPISGLKICGEQDGYRYFFHPVTHQVFSLSSDGTWYFQMPNQEFVDITDDIQEEMKKVRRKSKYIEFDAEGHPLYPRDDYGYFILPLDAKGGKIFPFDEMQLPVFPWDPVKKQWTLPVDDTHQCVFPFNEQGLPMVPVDENDRPIFPVDHEGAFVFPLGSDGQPMPAMTPGVDGKWVVPTDSKGEPVVPFDAQGNPLIHITSDGTPVSQAQYLEWQQMNANAFEANQTEGFQQEEEEVDYKASIKNFMRSKRVRPEDIDLPEPAEADAAASPQAPNAAVQAPQFPATSSFANFAAQSFPVSHGQQEDVPMQIDTESDAADKRKRMLTLALKRQLKLQKGIDMDTSLADESKNIKPKPEPVNKSEKPKLVKQKMEMWVPPDSSKTIERIREESSAVASHINRGRRSPDRRPRESRFDARDPRDSRRPRERSHDRAPASGHWDHDRRRDDRNGRDRRRSRSRDGGRREVEDRRRSGRRSRSREAASRRRRSGSRENRRRDRRSRSREDRREHRKSVTPTENRRRSRSQDRGEKRRDHRQKRRESRTPERPVKREASERKDSREVHESRTPREEKKPREDRSPSPKRSKRSESRESSSSSSSSDSDSSSSSDSSCSDSDSNSNTATTPVKHKTSEVAVASKWDSPERAGSESPMRSPSEKRNGEKTVGNNGKHYDN
ncbi:hypothetical protein L596_018465 [Steinernema carpocapsae]|uniref:Uncharacterized protein n=1 Tax=Steinernema carpocapsae TaxID=34508 RepID=A0A4V6A219_STECR|nr:hypothetical protein L596_018465 [Steinernema carpocapsae]